MHLIPTVSTIAVLSIAFIGLVQQVYSNQNSEGAFDRPNTKKSGKIPRWTFDVGFLNVESFFSQHKLEDRLRLSKAYIKHNVRSKLFPTEDPLYSIKHSLVEELINCDNLTNLVEPIFRVPLIDCRPLEAHTVDETYVSPVSDQSINQYVRRSSFRAKASGTLFKRSSRHDLLIYPLKRDVVKKYIKSYLTVNKLGDPISAIESNINLGYYVHAETGDPMYQPRFTCIGEVYLSINTSRIGYTRKIDDPFPEYVDDFNFVFRQATENGYMLSLHEFKCGRSGLFDITLDIDFTIVQRQVFPYLFVRHEMITGPHGIGLTYNSSVDQVNTGDDQASDHPESYNTTVKIRSNSIVLDLMNFGITQTFVNKDYQRGFETANLASKYFPIIVNAFWDDQNYFKQFRFLQFKLPGHLLEMMNITWLSETQEDAVKLSLDVKKSLFDGFSIDSLSTMLNLDETIEYNIEPEDEQSIRDEL